jgi:AraC-like DNA-binding protein
MSLYTTPLQFGYFFGLALWIILLVRGYRQDRLSDKLLGWVMFILSMELQDYTFGFAGINVLWNELNGFPRSVSLLFGPVIYFYFLSQVNRDFTLKKAHLAHLIPYGLYFIYQLSIFTQGSEQVDKIQNSSFQEAMGRFYLGILYGSFVFYISRCLKIYHAYRVWVVNQFSNQSLIGFTWFRNFLFAMIFWLVFRAIMNILDSYFNLEFYQDWWWNLGLILVVFYTGLAGYAQPQPTTINFDKTKNPKEPKEIPQSKPETERGVTNLNQKNVRKLHDLMQNERLYLQSDLNLHQLAQHLNLNSSQLSATINKGFDQNFNDYINGLRIEAFIEKYQSDSAKHLTMLAVAYDSGFNSKATFNRAFKKNKGVTPKTFFIQEKEY